MKKQSIKFGLLFGSALLALALIAPALARAQSSDQVQDGLQHAREFMVQYEKELSLLERPDSYGGEWGFKYDRDGIAKLHNIIKTAQVASLNGRDEEAAQLLDQWESTWTTYDSVVNKQLQSIDFRYLTDGLIGKDIPANDAWLKDLKNNGYQVDNFVSEWNELKRQVTDIQSNWAKDIARSQNNLHVWQDKYADWSHRLEAQITASDRDSYSQWKKALQEWVNFDQAYLDAEENDIASAAKDGLSGAEKDLAFLRRYRSLFDQARKALDADSPADADKLLNQIDKELMQYWSKEAKGARAQLDQSDKEFSGWLLGIRGGIDALREKKIDVTDLEKSFVETSETLKDAKDAASKHCSTYVECNDGLDEYDGYYAFAKYDEMATWQDWWNETLKQSNTETSETSETNEAPSYYVAVSVDPILPTAQLGSADRLGGPVTISVDAPGASEAEVYVREAANSEGTGERELIGTADKSNGFTVKWAADESWQMAEITATAYGQPDVDYSRTSDPYFVMMPPSQTSESAPAPVGVPSL